MLIPAGSGIYRYAEIDIEPPAGYEPPPRIEEVPVAQPQLTAAGVLREVGGTDADDRRLTRQLTRHQAPPMVNVTVAIT